MLRDVIGLVDCHNCPDLGPLTANRPLASTSFLGRFAFIDFALSNFTNSEIGSIGILVKDHQRSILKHLGNNTAWLRNTKTGLSQILANERGILNPPYNHDINNLKENDWILYSSNASYLVFVDPHIVTNIDLRPIIQEHIDRRETMTVVYSKIPDSDTSCLNEHIFEVDEDNYLISCRKNDGKSKNANVSLSIWIINRTLLAEIINRHGSGNPLYGLKEMFPYLLASSSFKIHAHEHKGYVRCFDSLEHYVKYSFELLEPEAYSSLFRPDWPIYTLTHDTPPALYGEEAEVTDSFVANGCIVRGKVKHSIISREVKVAPGALIEDSIVFSDTAIGNDVIIKNALVDKYCVVTRKQKVVGHDGEIAYLKQGAIL